LLLLSCAQTMHALRANKAKRIPIRFITYLFLPGIPGWAVNRPSYLDRESAGWVCRRGKTICRRQLTTRQGRETSRPL